MKNKSYIKTIKLTKSLTNKIQRSNRALQQRAGSPQSGPKQRRFLPLCYIPNPIPLSSQGDRPRQSLRLHDLTHVSNQQLLDYYTSYSYLEKHRILRPVWVIQSVKHSSLILYKSQHFPITKHRAPALPAHLWSQPKWVKTHVQTAMLEAQYPQEEGNKTKACWWKAALLQQWSYLT